MPASRCSSCSRSSPARSIWIAWHERSGDARAEAVFDLVGQRTRARVRPTRPARWRGCVSSSIATRERLDAGARAALPERRRGRRSRARASCISCWPRCRRRRRRRCARACAAGDAADRRPAALRRQRLVEFDGRDARRDPPARARRSRRSRRCLRRIRARGRAGPRRARRSSIDAGDRAAGLPAVPGPRPPRPVRVYAVSEDGTLVSAPVGRTRAAAGRAAARELSAARARPGLPTFAPEEFFFRFDPSASRSPRWRLLGLLSRSRRPRPRLDAAASDRRRALTASAASSPLDLAFDIDWRELAASVDAPVVGAAVTVADAVAPFVVRRSTPRWPATRRRRCARRSTRSRARDLQAGGAPMIRRRCGTRWSTAPAPSPRFRSRMPSGC